MKSLIHPASHLTPVAFLLAVVSLFAIGCSKEQTTGKDKPEPPMGDVWMTDFEAAKTAAAAEGKDLFLEFTGSDWCAPCKLLNREVFSKAAFLNAAAPNFILVKLDFPSDKSLISEETQKQNDELFELYQIEGYPSVILTDASGLPYTEIEEFDVGLDPYLVLLEEARQIRIHRDKAMQAAAELEGLEKAKALHEALNFTGLNFNRLTAFYGDALESIRANDPDDVTGVGRKSRAQQRMNRFMDEINEVAVTGDFDAVLPMIDTLLTDDTFEPADIQQILLMRAITFGQLERFDEAIKALDDAIAAMPDADIVGDIQALKADFTTTRDALNEGN